MDGDPNGAEGQGQGNSKSSSLSDIYEKPTEDVGNSLNIFKSKNVNVERDIGEEEKLPFRSERDNNDPENPY